MAGLVRRRTSIPDPGGMTGEQASTVYAKPYGELPVPATHYATSATSLRSLEVVPDIAAGTKTAGVVDRHDDMRGYKATGGRVLYATAVPPRDNTPYSSKFQEHLIGPQVNYVLNARLYRSGYPAATVMNGGKRNQALSTRVAQIPTRTTGGPGPAAMTTPQRRFSRVQTIPRYSTMPQSYPTQSAQG